MSKYFVIAAALALAVACNKKEEAPATDAGGTTVEQTAPATETAPEATEAAPADAAPAEAAPTEAAPAQ
jgi:hypothetical protein